MTRSLIISLITSLLLSSAFPTATTKSVLLIVIAVCKQFSFPSTYILLNSLVFNGAEEESGFGGNRDFFPSFQYFAKSSCISNSGGKSSSYPVLFNSSFKFSLNILESLTNC